MKKSTLIILVAILLITKELSAQNMPIYVNIGQRCPDFTIGHIEYYSKKSIKISDFRGKWLILDFWNKNCSYCIANFPELNRLQKQFAGKVQFLQVGVQDKENQIRPLYHRLHNRLHLNLACAFDSTICKRLDIYSAPQVIFIDPQGIVRAYTEYFTSKNISDFLAGLHPILRITPHKIGKKKTDGPIFFDTRTPFLTQGNGGADTDFLFRSLLAKWNPKLNRSISNNIIDDLGKYYNYNFQLIGATVENLYRNAYWWDLVKFKSKDSIATIWPFIIFEITDTTSFKPNFSSGKNIFSYSLTVPSSKYKKELLGQVMQSDLKNYFGYEVILEERKMPCWRLVATDSAKAKLKTKGGPKSVSGDLHYIINFQNVSLSEILRFISPSLDRPYFDETGIVGKIDMVLDTGNELNTNKDAVSKALIANGLQWIKGEKDMKVLVLRDPKADVSANRAN